MTKRTHNLVHANLAQPKADIDEAIMKGFSDRMDEIDAQAQRWPGFVSQPELPDEGKVYTGNMILNVSIWESVETLETFVNNSNHSDILDRPEEGFLDDDHPPFVLFWIPVAEGVTEQVIKERFDILQDIGPSPAAFTIERRFTVEAFLTSGLRRKPNTNLT